MCQIDKRIFLGVRFNIISLTNKWVGVKFPEKQHYVTLEWPLSCFLYRSILCKCERGLSAPYFITQKQFFLKAINVPARVHTDPHCIDGSVLECC